jgi:hypothetical protein
MSERTESGRAAIAGVLEGGKYGNGLMIGDRCILCRAPVVWRTELNVCPSAECLHVYVSSFSSNRDDTEVHTRHQTQIVEHEYKPNSKIQVPIICCHQVTIVIYPLGRRSRDWLMSCADVVPRRVEGRKMLWREGVCGDCNLTCPNPQLASS